MRVFFKLCLITALAVLVHGYHLGADDAEIYIPAIKKAANPLLYRFGAEFFMAHAHWSLFPLIVGESARISCLPVNTVIFLCYIAGVFLLLFAGWQIAGACFANEHARWASVGLVAAVFSVPVAGTALTIMDPYVTARTLSAPATMLALAAFLTNRPRTTAVWLVVTAFLHPQMCVYGTAFVFCAALMRRKRAVSKTAYALATLGPILDFEPAQGPAREALLSRTYFFVSNWTWYEWAGIFAPVALVFWASKLELRGTTRVFRDLARAVAPFGMLFTAAALILSSSSCFENLARMQPMRAFHVVYVIFFMMLGGLIGEYVLKDNAQRWALLFLPIAASMWLLQLSMYPNSVHIEWPGSHGRGNSWTNAFVWIRDHTPRDAVFALDPDYMLSPGEDEHGFRAIAERSALADDVKDSGAVSLFPQLAHDWKSQSNAQRGWRHFQRSDFERLASEYPVTWIVTLAPAPPGFACPYLDNGLAVCRIPAQ